VLSTKPPQSASRGGTPTRGRRARPTVLGASGGNAGERVGGLVQRVDAMTLEITLCPRQGDLAKVQRHWDDILPVVVSIYTGRIRAYDVMRMLQRDGNPTPLGDAIAAYGRIFQDAAHPHLRGGGAVSARHQGHPQPAGVPPRSGREDLPRSQG
jgi:hypothetical protein